MPFVVAVIADVAVAIWPRMVPPAMRFAVAVIADVAVAIWLPGLEKLHDALSVRLAVHARTRPSDGFVGPGVIIPDGAAVRILGPVGLQY